MSFLTTTPHYWASWPYRFRRVPHRKTKLSGLNLLPFGKLYMINNNNCMHNIWEKQSNTMSFISAQNLFCVSVSVSENCEMSLNAQLSPASFVLAPPVGHFCLLCQGNDVPATFLSASVISSIKKFVISCIQSLVSTLSVGLQLLEFIFFALCCLPCKVGFFKIEDSLMVSSYHLLYMTFFPC